jgi:hypothetical protein
MNPFTFTKALRALGRFGRRTVRLAPLALLGGCGYATSVTWVSPPPRLLTPRSPESVEVFAGTTPPRPHVGIAVLEIAEVSGSYAPKNKELLHELKREAGRQGCDAISLGGFVNRASAPTCWSTTSRLTGRALRRFASSTRTFPAPRRPMTGSFERLPGVPMDWQPVRRLTPQNGPWRLVPRATRGCMGKCELDARPHEPATVPRERQR